MRSVLVEMNSDMEKMHLQSLEEYVLDEEKIVTYRWLSKVLNIHVNLSKELLQKFSTNHFHSHNLYLTYLLSGKVKDGSYCILVVGQDKFEETKLKFDVITSHHVYSIQKKKEIPSADLLYMINSERVENDVNVLKQIGVIKCAFSIQRAEDEMSNLRLNSLLQNAPRETVVPTKTKHADSVKQENKKETKDKTPEKKTKVGTGGIAAMFAAQSSKSSSTTSSSTKTEAKPHAKKVGGINSFFSKVPKSESDVRQNSNVKQPINEPMDIDDSADRTDKDKFVKDIKSEDKAVAQDVQPEEEKISPLKTVQPKASTTKSNGSITKNKQKRKSKPKSSVKQEKTRKRIKVIDSDTSDDMFGSDNEDEPVDRNTLSPPPSRKIIDSDEEVIPPTPQPLNDSKNHRKRKVIKDKSYMDDDGFIVTEKVTVYESCTDSDSENKDSSKKVKEEEDKHRTKKPEEDNGRGSPKKSKEEENSTSKSAKSNKPSKASKDENSRNSKDMKKPTKKTVSPVKNKQASLMSFFKKV